ncbi:DNA starvation/stationary phase protection protein [bacterium]|nr:DNA starvation/stationary phase protection protein [bacterium]
MEKINIGIDKSSRDKVSEILNKILSDEYVLYTKIRNFHWNVNGIHFNDLHKFFEEQYESINESIDEIAERIRMLGNFPKASLKDFLENSSIKEVNKVLKSEEMILELLNDNEYLIREIRQNLEKVSKLNDAGNEDFLNALMQKHEKIAWFLRSMNI